VLLSVFSGVIAYFFVFVFFSCYFSGCLFCYLFFVGEKFRKKVQEGKKGKEKR